MIDFYIFCKGTGLEKLTGANCDQVGPLVEILPILKVGAFSGWHYIVNKNVE